MRNNDDFLHLSSILRMATKYCIDWLRRNAIRYISRFWPHKLQDWLNLNHGKKGYAAHPALVINLARKVELPFLLPLAFYLLGRLSPAEAHDVELTSSTGPIPHTAYRLSLEDILNHLRYKRLANVAASSFFRDMIDITPDNTRNHASDSHNPCSKPWSDLGPEICMEFLCNLPFPISFIEMTLEMDAAISLCSSCEIRLNSIVTERSRVFWDELPSWFGLPGWDVLTTSLMDDDES